jgi:hypothetical protein
MFGAFIEIGPELRTVGLAVLAALSAYWARQGGKELKNNGGSSVRDAIDRIEARQVNTDKRLDAYGIPKLPDLIPVPPPPPSPATAPKPEV